MTMTSLYLPRYLIEPEGFLLLKSKGFDKKTTNRKNGCRHSLYRATVGVQKMCENYSLTILEIWQTY